MDSDDEDVIFENSALHKALKEMDSCNVVTEPRINVSPSLHLHEKQDTSAKPEFRVDVFDAAIHEKTFLPVWFVKQLVSSDYVKYLHQQKMKFFIKKLLSSKLLLEDDMLFLENLIPSQDEKYIKQKFLYSTLVWFIGLVLIIPSLAIGLYYHGSIQFTQVTISLILSGGTTFILATSLFLFLKHLSDEFSTQESHLTHFENAAMELVHVQRKCLRIIQESEMVARGFTIASQRHLMSRFSCHKNNMVDQICPTLRKSIVQGNRNLTSNINEAVLNLSKDMARKSTIWGFNPLGGLMELSQHCGRLSIAETGDDQLTPGTIKSSVDLLGLFLSGLICKIALCFYQDGDDRVQIDTSNVIDPFRALLPTLTSFQSSLASSYMLLRAVNCPDERSELKKDVGQDRVFHNSNDQLKTTCFNTKAKMESFYTCVHSLDLHLQSVLLISRELAVSLEGKLETADKYSDKAEVTTVFLGEDEVKHCADILQQIQAGLASCGECHIEAAKRLRQMEATEPKKDPAPLQPPSPVSSPTMSAPLVHIPSEDPIIEDEFFEGVTDKDDEYQESHSSSYTEEDKVKHIKFRDMAKSLRVELQAVIGEKAKEQRIREEKALARVKASDGDLGLGPLVSQDDAKLTQDIHKNNHENVNVTSDPLSQKVCLGLKDPRENALPGSEVLAGSGDNSPGRKSYSNQSVDVQPQICPKDPEILITNLNSEDHIESNNQLNDSITLESLSYEVVSPDFQNTQFAEHCPDQISDLKNEMESTKVYPHNTYLRSFCHSGDREERPVPIPRNKNNLKQVSSGKDSCLNDRPLTQPYEKVLTNQDSSSNNESNISFDKTSDGQDGVKECSTEDNLETQRFRFPLTSSVASMVASRARLLHNTTFEDTFGDSSSDSE